MRKPSAILRELALTQSMQQRRHDPETVAMLSNCDFAIDGNDEEPPNVAAKQVANKGLDGSFYHALPRKVDIRGISSPCNTNGQAPLATSTVNNIDSLNA